MSMGTSLRSYVRGHSLVSMREGAAGTKRYFHFDHQGTTQALTDSTGAVTDRFASDAWGVQVKRTGNSINRFWYIGVQSNYTQDSSTYYSPLGYMSSMIGRYLSIQRMMTPPYSSRVMSRTVLPTQQPREGFRIAASRLFRPEALSNCGGAQWIIEWGVRDHNNRPPNRQHVCGWIIQHVRVNFEGESGVTRTCGPEARSIPESHSWLPRKWEYYEAWLFRHFASGNVVPENLKNDTFKYPGIDVAYSALIDGREIRKIAYHSSEGEWEIRGDTVFIQVPCPMKDGEPDPATLPPLPHSNTGWLDAGRCNRLRLHVPALWTINLRCTLSEPHGFAEASPRIRRRLYTKWSCGCGPGCVCEECSGTWGTVDPRVYKCQNTPGTSCPV